jgi:2'-phosphotransferase
MGPDGYVLLDQILNHSHPRFRGLTQEMVEGVVASSNKQRFALTKKDDGKLYIRANQGHSLDIIDPYQLLTPLSAEELSQIPTIVHGTYLEPWTKHIQNQGLSKMCRTHIHFAKGMPNDAGVISGMRRTSDVYIYVNAIKCAQDGIEFLESANGVLLTAGIDGMLATKYFSHVVSKSGEVLLDQRHAEDGQS